MILREAGPPILDDPDFSAYQRRVEELLARAGRLEDAQVRAVLATLRDVRRRTVEELLRVPADAKDGWRAAQLAQLRAAIDGVTADFQRRYGAQLTGAVDQAWQAGSDFTGDALNASGVRLTLAQELSRAQLEVTATLRADLVRRVGADMREQLARAVTLGIAGEKSPTSIMAQIAGILKTEPARLAPELGPIATQAERIVRTEMGRAFNTADRIRHDEIAEGTPGLMHYWMIATDRSVKRHRPTHLAAGSRYAPGGSTGPIPYKDAFTVGGEKMRYPHDPRGSARNTINCFPGSVEVSAPGIQGVSRRWYQGEVVTIKTASGHELTGTPNHPIATSLGWIALGKLHEGQYVISGRSDIDRRDMAGAYPEVFNRPTRLDEIASTLLEAGEVHRASCIAVDFHGDGGDGDVDIVAPGGQLRSAGKAALFQRFGKLLLPSADILPVLLMNLRAQHQFAQTAALAPNGIMGSGSQGSALLGGHAPHSQYVGLRAGANGDGGLNQAATNHDALQIERLRQRQFGFARNVAADDLCIVHVPADFPQRNAQPQQVGSHGIERCMIGFGDGMDAFAGLVALDNIISIKREMWAGHVYNLQSDTGWYIANNIIAHNCRCVDVLYNPEWYANKGED